MSILKTATIATACLFATISIANAEQVRLSTDQLDQVTAGAITPIGSGFTGGATLPGLLNPPPPPETPTPPTTPPTGGSNPPNPTSYFTSLIQGYLAGILGNLNL